MEITENSSPDCNPKKCFQELSNEKMGELLKENTETLLFDLTVMSLVGTPFGPIEDSFDFPSEKSEVSSVDVLMTHKL